MARSALAHMKKEHPARIKMEYERFTRLKEEASVGEEEMWEDGAPDWGLQTVIALLGGTLVLAAGFAAISSASDVIPYILFAVPFVVVFGAFVYGAYPHGTEKQRIDAATALAVYVAVVVVWLIARRIVEDEQLLRAIDAFAVFGQLASFLTSIKESVLAWIAPTQFRVLTPAGRQARIAQRQLNQVGYIPELP